ncbi:MAG TPA: hypothetical protein VKU19_32310 [Bryobacteraceae bacterium]|nr:hypothetical protein [Bryobacteraceae bacterium]
MSHRLSKARLLLLFLTVAASSAPRSLTFTGDMQRLTDGSISIRLSDGRIIEARAAAAHGDLSPYSLAKRYKVGDVVEITCEPIPGVFDEHIGRRLVLELKKLRFVREPAPEERAQSLMCKAWRQPPNLLESESQPAKAAAASLSPPLDEIRTHILQFIAEMPNFVADEVAQRYVSTSHPPDWRPVDTIQSEITFKGNAVSRSHIEVNGTPWNRGYRALTGFKWTDAFGSQLKYLFAEDCPTSFEGPTPVTEDGTTLIAVQYKSPSNGCEFYWQNYEQFYPAKTGRILLDEHAANVMRLETHASGFPDAFPIASIDKQVNWGFVQIGDAAHLLPISAEIQVVLSTGEIRLAKQEYKNHRHFEAASNITFH